jgi:hypothetical protein
MTAAGLTRRINHGRGHRYELEGRDVDGVTTVIGAGVPKPALIGWAARTTAGYALDHWDELAALGIAERLRRLERAQYETSHAAAARGTEIHRLAAKLAAGDEVDVDETTRGHVDAYLRFADDWNLADELVEAVVISRRWSYMGSLDLVATIAGERWLLDLKTSASGIWPETALQLAAYANAETYIDGETEQPMPTFDRAGAVWLRADGYDLVPVDKALDAETFRTFLYAQQVAHFAKTDRAVYIGDALRPPAGRRLEVV